MYSNVNKYTVTIELFIFRVAVFSFFLLLPLFLKSNKSPGNQSTRMQRKKVPRQGVSGDRYSKAIGHKQSSLRGSGPCL